MGIHLMWAWKMSSKVEASLEAARKSGLTEDDIEKCLTQFSKELHVRSSPEKTHTTSSLRKVLTFLWILVYRIFPIILVLVFLFQRFYIVYQSEPCLLAQPVLSEFAVPLLDCAKCRNITRALEIYNISVIQFMNEHAFSLQPVLMKGAASDWSAIHTFSYQFFKDLYMQKPEAIDHDKSDGQFFPYSSSIHKLDEFMSLNNDTATMKGEKWYIGWSTTDPFIGEELRKHLKEPYFLPPKASDPNLAWIFMGSPGPGASLHIDWVGRPSWQAQLSGTKTWTLAPPPECENDCSLFNVTVHTGDIIVLDTNSWFHATYIHPGNISITFGTEYE